MPTVVPLTPAYQLSVSVHRDDLPTTSAAVTQLLVDRIARPLSLRLADDGYNTPTLDHIVHGALVVTREDIEVDHTVFLATFPRPLGPPPANTLYTMSTITAELVGGVHDGLRVEPATRARDVHEQDGTPYARTGYHLTDGVWVYQYVKQPAREEH